MAPSPSAAPSPGANVNGDEWRNRPLEVSDPSSPWGSLIDTIRQSGLVDLPSKEDGDDGNDDDELQARECDTLGDLLLLGDNTNAGSNEEPEPQKPPLLLVLVSGSWCAPCRNFTPVLAACCETPSFSSGGVKVIFCSADHDAPSFLTYFAKMPRTWSALPFDEDGEDDRDDLMENLGAMSLPALLVFDPLRGALLEANAVHAVQAVGAQGCGTLLGEWRKRAGQGAEAKIRANSTNATSAAAEGPDHEGEDGALHFSIPSPLNLVCQYFKERLLSPDLPESLSGVVLKRTAADADMAAVNLADGLRERTGPGERWLFRTAAPALPGTGTGGTVGAGLSSLGLGLEAHAVECWEVYRGIEEEEGNKDDGKDNATNGANELPIVKAIVNIENETARSVIVFRERIEMVQTQDEDGLGMTTEVTKTLDLTGVPAVARGAFRRRWKTESDLIFHALLGSCDRRKKKAGAGTG